MLNRTSADLADPTVRVRLFGGRAATDVAADMPILAVDAPGIAPPGPNLIRQARNMGDPEPPAPKKGSRRRTARPCGPWLTGVVRSAVYQPDTLVATADGSELYQPGLLIDGGAAGERFGPGRCRLFVVGKCLGRTEVSTGRPFSGFGSRDLWTAWTEAGLPPAGAGLPTYFTNLVPFVPPPSMQTRLPADVQADGLHLLHQQLAVARPDVILTLGAEATKAVLGRSATITGYRGRLGRLALDFRPTAESPADEWSTVVVAADHPAAVGHDPDKYPGFIASMKYLARHLGFDRTPVAVARDHQMIVTTEELVQAVAESVAASAGGGYVAFDCEWDGRHPCDPAGYLYTVQWSHAPGHARVLFLRRCGGAVNPALDPEVVRRELGRLLAAAPARGARLVGHFAKADLPWLHALGVDLYPHFVGPRDDPPDAPGGALTAAQKTAFEGGFDTYVAGHAVDETQTLKLEVLSANLLGIDRYDVPLVEWLADYCKRNKIRKSRLTGYGMISESVIFPYAAWDADAAGRQYLLHNGDPRAGTTGLLDRDRFGNSSRPIFAVRMRAWAAVAEMERYGMEVDRAAQRRNSATLVARRAVLLEELKRDLSWPDGVDGRDDFSAARPQHLVEVLFGESYTKARVPARPSGAVSLYLRPYKATDTTGGGRLWADALYRHRRNGGVHPEPSADKETLIALQRESPIVEKILQIKELDTALKIVFRPPDAPETDEDADPEAEAPETDVAGEEYSAGLMSLVHHDGRVRTMIGLVETGRYGSSRPNLMNVSDAADDRLMRILRWGEYAAKGSPDAARRFASRDTFRARDGWFLVNADLKGAEIAAAGWSSDDTLLIDHARRSTLPKSDPDWLDLHSDLANTAFRLGLPLGEVAKKHKPLRVAAKRARFGHYYGASPDTILRQCLQESKDVRLEDVETIVTEHDRTYPDLARFFAGSRGRIKVGWLRNGFGGTRRFRMAGARDVVSGQEREAQNWTCQGLVADAISYALGNLWYALHDQGMRSRVLLSVHDSIVMECPPEEVAFVADELLPWAMGVGTPVVPTDFAGRPTGRGPYHFGVDVEVCLSWGTKLKEERWRAMAAEATTAA